MGVLEDVEQNIDGAISMAGELAKRYKINDAAASAVKSVGKMAEDVGKTGFNRSDLERDQFMLAGKLGAHGYDCWWQSFSARSVDTGEEKRFFISFYALNPQLGSNTVLLGQSEESKRKKLKPSYLMVKAGVLGEDARQGNRFFAWKDVSLKEGAPFSISADNCYLSETRTLGRISISEEEVIRHPEWKSQAMDLIWDLDIDKEIAFNVGYGAGKTMRGQEASPQFWHAEGMKTSLEGTIVYEGNRYQVRPETSYGYADKRWGSASSKPWICLSSSNMFSKAKKRRLSNSAFTIAGGSSHLAGVHLENGLMGALWYEGEPYQYNFSHVWTLTKTRYKVKVGKHEIRWRILQETPLSKMYTEVHCSRKEMLALNYEDPDGEPSYSQLLCGAMGTGSVKIYRKSLKKNWKWELLDELELSHVLCQYGEA